MGRVEGVNLVDLERLLDCKGKVGMLLLKRDWKWS